MPEICVYYARYRNVFETSFPLAPLQFAFWPLATSTNHFQKKTMKQQKRYALTGGMPTPSSHSFISWILVFLERKIPLVMLKATVLTRAKLGLTLQFIFIHEAGWLYQDHFKPWNRPRNHVAHFLCDILFAFVLLSALSVSISYNFPCTSMHVLTFCLLRPLGWHSMFLLKGECFDFWSKYPRTHFWTNIKVFCLRCIGTLLFIWWHLLITMVGIAECYFSSDPRYGLILRRNWTNKS